MAANTMSTVDTILPVDWPLPADAPPVMTMPTDVHSNGVRLGHPNTPYQPHNGYGGYKERKRYLLAWAALIISFLSSAAAATLYATIGSEMSQSWAFIAWIVSSMGLTVTLAPLVSLFRQQYDAARGPRQGDGSVLDSSPGIELQSIDRRELEPAEVPASVRALRSFHVPPPPAHLQENTHSPIDGAEYDFPFGVVGWRGRMVGQDFGHVSTSFSETDDHANPLRSSPNIVPA